MNPPTVFYIIFVPVFGLLALTFAIVSFLTVVSMNVNEPPAPES